MTRSNEQFREMLRKAYTPTDIRLADSRSIARQVDGDAAAKCRVHFYHTAQRRTAKLVNRMGDDDFMDGLKDKKTYYNRELGPCSFDLEDNIPLIYWNYYSEGFYGEDCPSNDGQWDCPKCGRQYRMSLKLLPMYCSCGKRTPLGRLAVDGVLKR